MKLNQIKSLDDLANYFGYPSYEKLKGLLYPLPLYTTFKIPKRTGGDREIHAPAGRLKSHQRILAEDLKRSFGQRSPVAHSFIPKRSIVTNALPHVGRASVVRVDLTDFFGHITFGRIKGVFQAEPFLFPNDVATVLAQMCCYKGVLPQGAPTSAVLTNFVCLALDGTLQRMAKRFKGRYTRYSDDLTFSFKYLPLEKLSKDFLLVKKNANGRTEVTVGPNLEKAILDAGFKVNEMKTRGANQDKRQMITGLVANKNLTPSRKYIDELRRALYIWSKEGAVEAEKRSLNILHNRNYASGVIPNFESVIRGKLNFLSMVTGKSGSAYQRYALQYNRLVLRDFPLKKGAPLKIEPKVQNVQDALKATWYLQNGNCFEGTAFRFNGNVWVTCAHCVGDIRTKEIFPDILLSSSDWSMRELKVRVAAIDWQRDLAILRPEPMVSIPRNLAYFIPAVGLPDQDSRVGIMGFPGARLMQPPIFMNARVLRCRTKASVSRIEIDKNILKGNSGGPLFNENYQVLGVVVEGAVVLMKEDDKDYEQGENACVAIGELLNLKSI